jgi:histidyl-tRNA synthetase
MFFDSSIAPCQTVCPMEIKSLRGMNDVTVPEISLWHFIENNARRLYEASGFHEVRTPILESTQLFKRGVGETTDVVEKEMYSFDDRNGENISLRPEGTASIVRALIEHGWLNLSPIQKIYYHGPMFRHERPQKGRFRQHFQFGLEIFGVEGPDADVEIMAIQSTLFNILGLKDVTLKVSSIGCHDCRPAFKEKLLKILKPRASELCGDCQKRIERNPLRVFDCKVPTCQAIAKTLPTMMENLCENCRTHQSGVENGLKSLSIPYVVDPRIVRGLDYYTRTAFEFVTDRIGAQGTVCGGGRYDGLVKELGGPAVPAVGCGMGEERLAMLLEESLANVQPKTSVFVVLQDPSAKDLARQLCFDLRRDGISAQMDLQGRSMKSQFKYAERVNAQYALILGGPEMAQGEALFRPMNSKEQNKSISDLSQEKIPIRDLGTVLKERLKKS